MSLTGTIICQKCGRETPKTGRAQKYCPECADHQKDEQQRAYKQRKRDEKEAATSSNKNLAETNARARAAHMTYGQYVSLGGG